MRASGWPLVGWMALALVGVSAGVLGVNGTEAEGLRAWIRVTAWTSVVLFLLAFVARPLRQLRRTDAARWMLANRRYLGVSFAVSHALHGVALIWLSVARPDIFQSSTSNSTLVLGGLGYAFVFAMVATSFDSSARWLGPARWRLLHRSGMVVLWLIFLATFVPSAAAGRSVNWLPSAALLVALGLRAFVWQRSRAAKASRAPA